jgi:hypothetical protein
MVHVARVLMVAAVQGCAVRRLLSEPVPLPAIRNRRIISQGHFAADGEVTTLGTAMLVLPAGLAEREGWRAECIEAARQTG